MLTKPELETPLLAVIKSLITTSHVIDLGVTSVEIHANRNIDECLRFFSPHSKCRYDEQVSFRLFFIDISLPDFPTHVIPMPDRTYAGGRFAKGYYVTDNFGSPVTLASSGNDFFVFGKEFDRLVWSYFVKLCLTLWGNRNGHLHIKASCFENDGKGVLIIGNGGTGKTVMLSQLCLKGGATFVSNTHCMVNRDDVVGVGTTMRVRRDFYFDTIIDRLKLPRSVNDGEFLLDPQKVFAKTSTKAKITSILLVDYSRSGECLIEPVSNIDVIGYMEQFSMALNAYSLKNQMLEEAGSDPRAFARACASSRRQLEALVAQSLCWFVSCDITNQEHMTKLLAKIGG
ncbi:hypothetical protein [Mesorhizobium sp. M8A.F.Ca.ET.208.01.1.1]|uniref:hypothetical protein n=1 Tax=Mesorhizobium sp. M8A.F.Ca.ET.208.01.1.1 TaxID=2563969 RepID=UPI001AEE8328|nr:hypothetical protein [Mesorhizobium sp. M8A.F.Ca.ET.208.01.1.1]